MTKDDGKCLNCLKNIMYDMLSFLLKADLLHVCQCLFEGLYTKPNSSIHNFLADAFAFPEL